MDRFNKNANISSIEDFLYSQIAVVLDNVRVGFIPSALEETKDDSLVLIDIIGDINYTVVPKVSVLIHLCAKNIGDTKNSNLLKQMEDKLDTIIESFQDENKTYTLRKVSAFTEPLGDLPYYCNVIKLQVSVFK